MRLNMILPFLILCGAGEVAAGAQTWPGGDAAIGPVAERGSAVRASISITLGHASRRQSVERISMAISAGPAFRLGPGEAGARDRMVHADMVRLSIGLAPAPVLRVNGVGVARIGPSFGADETDGGNGGLSGWAIAGGALAVGLGITYLALEDAIDCNEGGDYVCE